MFETSVVLTHVESPARRASLLTASLMAHSALIIGAIGFSIAHIDFPSNAPKAYERAPSFTPVQPPQPLGNPNGGAPPRTNPAVAPPPVQREITAPPAIPDKLLCSNLRPVQQPISPVAMWAKEKAPSPIQSVCPGECRTAWAI